MLSIASFLPYYHHPCEYREKKACHPLGSFSVFVLQGRAVQNDAVIVAGGE